MDVTVNKSAVYPVSWTEGQEVEGGTSWRREGARS